MCLSNRTVQLMHTSLSSHEGDHKVSLMRLCLHLCLSVACISTFSSRLPAISAPMMGCVHGDHGKQLDTTDRHGIGLPAWCQPGPTLSTAQPQALCIAQSSSVGILCLQSVPNTGRDAYLAYHR
jgi:hypothetical protein